MTKLGRNRDLEKHWLEESKQPCLVDRSEINLYM